MSRAYDQLQALIPRLDTFLSRLAQRAQEVCAEASQAVAALKDSGDRDTHTKAQQIQVGVESGMREIIAKGQAAFSTHFGPFSHLDDEDVEDLYSQLEDHMERWEEHIEAIAEKAFQGSDDKTARQQWEAALADWQAASRNFTCPQCSAPIAVPQLFTEAVYLPCSGCGARATFTPSSNMVLAKDAALSLAEIEARPALESFEAACAQDDIAPGLQFSHYANYLVTRQRKLGELLPSVAASERPKLASEFSGWVSQQPLELEPYGYWQTDLTYVNMLTGLTEFIDESRRVNADEDAAIAIDMAQAVARPGCPIVQAIVTGTVTRELLSHHANVAMSRPPLPVKNPLL